MAKLVRPCLRIIILLLVFAGSINFFIIKASAATSSSLGVDSDSDGYSDSSEIQNNYSPYNPEPVKITASDMDADSLSDFWELKFKTDPLNPDSDGDGHQDGEEIDRAFDPLSSSTKKLAQKIEINRKKQTLIYLVANQPWKEFSVSTGRPSLPTPSGIFKIVNKSQKAWSKTYKLWMPYWLGLDRGNIGIHELPLWPNGYREGEDHLGKAVSHGCIRLGIGSARYIYERAEIGMEISIK